MRMWIFTGPEVLLPLQVSESHQKLGFAPFLIGSISRTENNTLEWQWQLCSSICCLLLHSTNAFFYFLVILFSLICIWLISIWHWLHGWYMRYMNHWNFKEYHNQMNTWQNWVLPNWQWFHSGCLDHWNFEERDSSDECWYQMEVICNFVLQNFVSCPWWYPPQKQSKFQFVAFGAVSFW